MSDGEDKNKSSKPEGITLEELQRQFEATRARIREIERKALLKLRIPKS